MSSTSKVLITGASGLLGRAIHQVFKSDSTWNTLGLAYSRAKGDLQKVDITDGKAMKDLFEDFKPDVVIHAAAERRPDAVEQQEERTRQLNVGATENICQLAAAKGAYVVFISTDYVFDGKSPPYKESDTPNPLNKYGVSKLEGEKVVLAASKDNMVLRIPILYGDIEGIDESAVTVMFPKIKDNTKTCKMNNFQKRYPTHTHDVALVLRDLIDKRKQDPTLTGIFHWTGSECMTKYDMCIIMAEVFSLPTSHIEKDMSESSGAARPDDAHLETTRIDALGICHRTPFKGAIKDLLKQFL